MCTCDKPASILRIYTLITLKHAGKRLFGADSLAQGIAIIKRADDLTMQLLMEQKPFPIY